MSSNCTLRFLLVSLLAASGCVSDSARRYRPAIAEASAVRFLTREVPAWSRNNGCFSCHNNGDGARALYAAMRKGYRVPVTVLADTTAWVAQPGRWEHNKGDPGFSDLRLANIQFAASLLAALEAGLASDPRLLQEAARKVCADQGADGAWHIEPRNVVGSPATYGTTLATYMALKTLQQADASGAGEAIRKAEDWLRQARPNNVLSAATILLASALQSGCDLGCLGVPVWRMPPAVSGLRMTISQSNWSVTAGRFQTSPHQTPCRYCFRRDPRSSFGPRSDTNHDARDCWE